MSIATNYPTTDGERHKLNAFALLAARWEAVIRRARRALLQTMLAGDGIATADDVRAAVELPPGIDPKVFGAAPSELATARIIVRDGFTRSARPKAHARHVARWKLVDRAAAMHWLATHPELAVPGPGPEHQGELFVSI